MTDNELKMFKERFSDILMKLRDESMDKGIELSKNFCSTNGDFFIEEQTCEGTEQSCPVRPCKEGKKIGSVHVHPDDTVPSWQDIHTLFYQAAHHGMKFSCIADINSVTCYGIADTPKAKRLLELTKKSYTKKKDGSVPLHPKSGVSREDHEEYYRLWNELFTNPFELIKIVKAFMYKGMKIWEEAADGTTLVTEGEDADADHLREIQARVAKGLQR